MANTPVVLLILDGWGIRDDAPGNAIALAHPKRYQALIDRYPNIAIDASGEAVGLPEGQMGNSEVGHLNMGAGRVVYQEITRINKSIRDGDFFSNPVLLQAVEHAKKNDSTLHLMGLVSDGGVHSSLDHLIALIDLAKRNGLEKVRIHAFLDGRDVPPRSALGFLETVEAKLDEVGLPQIATVCGRYYAMDRDNRWDRTQLAYDTLTQANGRRFFFSMDAVKYSYEQDTNDEFVLPSVTDMTFEGMADNDAVFFLNFRPDRARQLTRAFTEQDFDGFVREKTLENLFFTSMTTYDANFTIPVAYPKVRLDCILSEVLSEHHIKQFRTAETEKYAHVTYFFNGGFEKEYKGEDRHMIPSPKVATYDEQPEMNVDKVADSIVEAVESGKYQVVIANYANPDMVGHTGILNAAVEAVQAVDTAIGRVADAVLAANGTLLITADHGNVENMLDENGGAHTAHTTSLVPMILVSNDASLKLDQNGEHKLSDVSPTILDLLGIHQPEQMTADSMLVRQTVTA